MQVKQVPQNEEVVFCLCRSCRRMLQVVKGSLCDIQQLCHRCSEDKDKQIIESLKLKDLR